VATITKNRALEAALWAGSLFDRLTGALILRMGKCNGILGGVSWCLFFWW